MFEEIIDKPYSDEIYIEAAVKDFQDLLANHGREEKLFQDFFEKNPCFVPNDDQYKLTSGHGPFMWSLITQPNIYGILNRKPDFLWLGKDSMNFSPTFIEIEAPDKKIFNKDYSLTREFTQARQQLADWKTTLNMPVNQMKFFDDFAIPLDMRRLAFKPLYVLVYGRRSEFEGNDFLTQKRSGIMGADELLMSYDRIQIQKKGLWAFTAEVSGQLYHAKYVSPALPISNVFKYEYKKLHKLESAIDNSVYITKNRKAFMKRRIKEIINEPDNQLSNQLPIWSPGQRNME